MICRIGIWLILMTAFAFSGKAQIKAVVQDTEGEVLPYANVRLLSYNESQTIRGTVTNEAGEIHYEDIVPGEYHLVILYVGFEPDTVPNILITGSGQLIDLGIRRLHPITLDEVVVTAQAKVIQREGNTTIFDVEKTTMSTGESAMSLMDYVPGVLVDADNEIVVNGKKDVLLFIGRRQQMVSDNELTEILRGIPSESIKQIEVTASASSRYDAAGGGAVVRIILKEQEGDGVNGSVWSRYRQGKLSSGFGGGNLNWKAGNFSGNVYYAFSYYQGFHDIETNRRVKGIGENESDLFFRETIYEQWTYVSHAPRLRLFYDVNDKHQLGIQADLSYLSIDFPNENRTDISNDGGTADSSVLAEIETNELRVFPSFNFNYHYVDGDKRSLIDLSYDFFLTDYDRESEFMTSYRDRFDNPSRTPNWLLQRSPLINKVHTASFDYSKGLKRSHYIEIGAKSTVIDKVSDVSFATRANAGVPYEEDESRMRMDDYREIIAAGYVNWAKELPKGWNLESGLRVEFTRTDQVSLDMPMARSRNFVGVFPFARFFKETLKGNSISMSYSRRTLRPTFDQLNPFELILNPYLVVSGDPDLTPQINNTIDLEFAFKNDFSFYAGYNLAQNSINSIFLNTDEAGVYDLTYVNFDRSHFFNAGFSAGTNINKWWQLTGDLNLAYDVYNATVMGDSLKRHGPALTFSANNEFTLPAKFYLNLIGYLESPRYTSIERFKTTGRVDMTLTKLFLDDNLSIKIRGRDLLNTDKIESELNYLGLRSDYIERADTRRFELSISYKFGSSNFRSRNNKLSNTEEKGRT